MFFISKGRKGRPKEINRENVQLILNYLTENCRSTLLEVTDAASNILGISVDKKIDRKELNSLRYFTTVAVSKPKLTENHVAARLARCVKEGFGGISGNG